MPASATAESLPSPAPRLTWPRLGRRSWRGVAVPQIAANLVVLTGAEAVSKVLAAAAFAFLARVLGPEAYGQVEFVLALTIFPTLIADLGLSAYGAREVAKDPTAAARLVAQIVALRLALAGTACLGLVVTALLLPVPWPAKQLLLLYGLTLFAAPGMLMWLFQARDEMHRVAAASVIRWGAFAAGLFLVVRGPAQLWAVPLIEGLALAAVVAFGVVSLLPLLRTARPQLTWSGLRATLRASLPIGGSDLVWALKTYSATVVLGVTMAAESVGWFGAAHRLVISLHTFVWLYYYNLFPSLARSATRPVDDLHRLLRPSLRLTAWAAVGAGILGTVLAEPAVLMLYGPGYGEAVPVLRALIWLVPVALVSGNFRFTLIAYDRQRREFLCNAVGAGVSIGLTLILTRSHGVIGAAWALVIAEALVGVLSYLLLRRSVVAPDLWRPLSGPALAVAGFTLVILVWR